MEIGWTWEWKRYNRGRQSRMDLSEIHWQSISNTVEALGHLSPIKYSMLLVCTSNGKMDVEDFIYCQAFQCTIIDIGDEGGMNEHYSHSGS